VTTWVENPEGGRDRGPRGLLRAWAEVLVRPRRFFRNGVAPGDQAPGLVFAVVVSIAYASVLFAFDPGRVPALAGGVGPSAAVTLAAVALLVAPALLHLTAALQTVLLILFVRDRGGVSETVQVLAYATAPCAFAGLPDPRFQFVCTAYGAALLVVGLAEVHDVGVGRAALVGALPAALVFGYAFGGFRAFESVLRAAGLI
jgi:hypothetical protein